MYQQHLLKIICNLILFGAVDLKMHRAWKGAKIQKKNKEKQSAQQIQLFISYQIATRASPTRETPPN